MAALIAGTAGAASAQTAPADDSAYLGEIVVTARKREEDVQRTPVAISVVSRDDIERKSIQTLKDIQRITPGLTFQQTPYDPMNSLIGIRGQRAADNLQGQDPRSASTSTASTPPPPASRTCQTCSTSSGSKC